MAPPYRISIGVSIDASGAKTGAATAEQAVSAIGQEAQKVAPQIEKVSQAVQKLSSASANNNAKQSVDSIATAAEKAKPTMDQLVNSFAKLNAETGRLSASSYSGLIGLGRELDRLEAKYDPLAAAQMRYEQALEDIGRLERAGIATASAAIDMRLRERNAYNSLADSLGRVASARKQGVEQSVSSISITPDRGADIAAYGQQLDDLRAKYNPVFAVLRNYKTWLAEIREDQKRGVIGMDEMTAAISRQRQAALAQVAALKSTGGAGGSSAANDQFRRQNLTYQLFDIGQTAYMGMNPMMIFAQQGPQIIQMYAGQGGVNAAMKDFGTIASGLGRLITPVTVGMAGLSAAALVGATAWSKYLTSTKEVETAASGLGRATAGSIEQMNAAARSGASAAGISVSSARSMEAQFLRTGKIGSENFESLISISKNFGATIGVSADDAATALSEMFADPAKAAETLYRQYGLISAATARQATSLAQQNRQSEAQAVLLKALPGQLADAARATTAFGRAWQWATTAASNTVDTVGQTIEEVVSGKSGEARIAELRKSLAQPRVRGREAMEKQLADLLAKQQSDAENQQAQALQRRAAGTLGLSEQSGANSYSLQVERLQNELKGLQADRAAIGASPDQGGLDDTQLGRVDSAIEAKTRALDALINRQKQSAELDRLDIQIQTERNPVVRADLEARRTRLQLSSQEVDAASIQIETENARKRVIESAIASSELQVRDMQLEFDIRSRLNDQVAAGTLTASDANRMLQEEIALRPLIAAAASAEGDEKQRLLTIIKQLQDGNAGLAQQQKDEAAIGVVRGQNDRLESMRAELSLLGQSDVQRRKSLALLEAEQQIRNEGLGGTKYADQIRANAGALADMTSALEKQTDAWSRYESAGESAIDTVFDGLSSGKFDFKSIVQDLTSDLTKSFTELAIKNPLKNQLFGTNYGTLDDLFKGGSKGGILDSILGGTKGAMTVNAASVIINGGVTSGLGGGLFGSAANSNSAASGVTPALGASAIDKGMSILGLNETSNAASINGFLKAGGVDINAAQTAWCAAFVNSSLAQVGVTGTGSLTANSFLNWGKSVDVGQVLRGDVLVNSRGLSANETGGHVGFATGATRTVAGQSQLEMLSGNSSNSVKTSWVNASDVQARRAEEASASLGTLRQSANSSSEAVGGLGKATGSATQGLSSLGGGMTAFGRMLATAQSGGGGSGLLGALTSLTSAGQSIFNGSSQLQNAFSNGWYGVSAGGMGLYDLGGYTGPGGVKEPAGVVHRGEIVWSQQDIARAGGIHTVEAMRLGLLGYDTGGVVDAVRPVKPVGRAAANGNTANNAASANGAGSRRMHVSMDFSGARGDREIEQAGYRGMQRALEEYHAGEADRFADYTANPRWRRASS